METIDYGMLFFVLTPVVLLTVFATVFIGNYERSQKNFVG